MVVNYAVLATLLWPLGCASHSNCSKGSEFVPPLCPLKLPAVRSIVITENASKDPVDADPSISCERFHVDEQGVRKYFELARSTNENDAHHTLDYSPCRAAGEVTFEDGSTGHWTLSQLRSGALTMGASRPIILYCPECNFEPFQ